MSNPTKTASLTVERLALSQLVPHPKNPRTHPQPGTSAWEALRKSIEHDYFDPMVWNKRNGMLVSGHLRRKVLEVAGFTEADCVVVDYDEPMHLARMIAANRGAGEDDDAALKTLLDELDASGLDASGLDLELAGFDADGLDGLVAEAAEDVPTDSTYTNKIVLPVYEPKGERPPVSDLIDRRKTDELLAAIEATPMPAEVAGFLRCAAERHTQFNFRQIAEFYCHADATVKDLMEKSALVLIDFDKAIENGFVHLSEKLGALTDQGEGEEHEG